VSRVASVRALVQDFDRPHGFELASFWDAWSRDFEQRRPRVEVTLRVADDVRRYLPGEPRVDDDGRVVVAFENLDSAFRELLRFGQDVEVLEPVELRERVAATSRRVAAMYGR
jgi:predicted DNA-binding transcriptional regulator YafY